LKRSKIVRGYEWVLENPINKAAIRGESMKEYKVAIYQEGALGSLILGESKVDPLRLTIFLNQHAAEGWRVVTVEREVRRMFGFWNREALVIIFEKEI
jgi:hypothetical protein